MTAIRALNYYQFIWLPFCLCSGDIIRVYISSNFGKPKPSVPYKHKYDTINIHYNTC